MNPQRLIAALVVFLLTAPVAHAAEGTAAAPLLKPEGSVDVFYGLNLNRPSDGTSFFAGIGTTARRANELSLNLASFGVSVNPEPLGMKLLLGYGPAMEVVHAGEPTGTAIGPEVWRAVQQASILYVGNQLTVEAGIYPCHAGFEYLQSQTNWTYTRSLLSEFAPYYQTGVRVGYQFTDTWSAQVHVLNGWQIIGDNNRAKTLGTQLAWTGERVTVAWNTLVGPENPGDDTHWRIFNDVVATFKVTPAFSLAAVGDVGIQQRPDAEPARWYGGALYGRYQLSEPLAVTVRAEVFHDPDAAISGTAQTLAEGTLSLEWKPIQHLVLKLEARHDRSTAAVFSSSDVPVPDQTLVVAGAVAYF
jgi:hypothetical protein